VQPAPCLRLRTQAGGDRPGATKRAETALEPPGTPGTMEAEGKHAGGSIARPAGTVALFTLLSRIFGLLRDVVVAFSFGAGVAADAFFVAFRIPNLLRRLVAEGALTASFLPVYVEHLERRGPEDAQRVVNVTFTILTGVLTALTLAGVLASPWVIRVFAPGFVPFPEKFQLAVLLNRFLFPYVFFVSLVALCMGILNARGHFAAPAASPVLLNLFMIAGALVLSRWISPPILGLAAGVLLGGAAQVLLQVPPLRARGVRLRLCLDLRDPAAGRIGRRFVPAAFGAAVVQLNVFVSNLLASFLPLGSISYLWYAGRLLEFPLGVFGVALATAAFPRMSRESSRRRMDALGGVLDRTLDMVAFICLPATVGLILLRTPIVSLLFERGAFDAGATQRTAEALFYYCLGLWPIAAARILVTAFHAVQDTTTPLKVAIVSFAVNVVFCLLLMGPMLHAGLALAGSVAALVNVVLLWGLFRRKAGPGAGGWARRIGGRLLVATGIMGGCVWGLSHLFLHGVQAGPWEKGGILAGCVCAGATVYLGACHVLGMKQVRELAGSLARKPRG